jgi:hypothetical protein
MVIIRVSVIQKQIAVTIRANIIVVGRYVDMNVLTIVLPQPM